MNVWICDPAHITPYYDEALCRCLVNRGHQVRFVSCAFRLDESIKHADQVQVDYHFFNRFFGLCQAKRDLLRQGARFLSYGPDVTSLIKRAEREKPAIVHLQWSRVPKQDLRLVKSLQSLGIKVVHTIHDVVPLYARTGGKEALEKVWSTCDGLIVHTKLNHDELLQTYPNIKPERVAIIPHGPLQSETTPAGASQARARSELGLPADAPIMLFFGVIKPYKGIDVLIKALPEIGKAIPNARLLIAGKAGPNDLPNLDEVRATTKVSIDAHLGFIPNADVWKFYLACDVSVLPYRSITQSGVLLSTFAFGRTAVVTRVGGLPELLEGRDFGWIVPPEDPPKLVEAVIASLRDRQATLAKGERAKEFVERELGWPKIADLTTSFYQKLIDS